MDALTVPAAGSAATVTAGLANVVIHVADVEQSLALYRDGLGLPVVFDSGWTSPPDMLALTDTPSGTPMRVVALRVAGGTGLSLASFRRAAATEPPFEAAGQVHVGITVRDLDAALASVTRHGARPIGTPGEVGPADRRARLAFLRDPDGVVLELVQPLSRDGD